MTITTTITITIIIMWHRFFQSQIANNCISWIVGQIDASKKEVNRLGTGLTVIPCPITTPMNLTFKFQIKACVSKMNAVARARSTFQMLTLLQKYLHHQSQYSKTWDRKCLALIAQQVRAFGINPKVGGSRPPQVETFSVSKTLTLSQEHPSMCRKWMLLSTHS